jgi:hypothetical protein
MRSMTFGAREASVAIEGEDARRTRRVLVGTGGVHRSEEQGDAVPEEDSIDSEEPRSEF